MSTTTVALDLTCPDWCTVPAEEHASELWDLGGTCIHWSDRTNVADPTGHRSPLQAPQPHEPLEVSLTTCTSPDGREVESPMMHLDGNELSIAQAVAVAERLQSLVAEYRAAGGVE
jgi:hypothetical protein